MTPNIALIGCGAISRAFYLPALARLRAKFGRVWLVDPSDHALSLAASVVPAKTAHQLGGVADDVQLVIVATPNHLHFPIALEALSRGADVLIEKPFVIWPEEGRQLVKAAAENNRSIAINQTRRFFPVARSLRRQIGEGVFGPLESITHYEGTKLAWPFESGAGFAQGAQRTGVVMDFGVHVVDFYHYLLQPEWKVITVTHDGFCGPEGLATIELQANGAPVSIRLSRYHQQENTARLQFERAEVTFNVYDSGTYSVRWKAPNGSTAGNGNGNPEAGQPSLGDQVLLNFLAVSQKREQAVCDAASSMPVIDLLDEVYRHAEKYPASPGIV